MNAEEGCEPGLSRHRPRAALLIGLAIGVGAAVLVLPSAVRAAAGAASSAVAAASSKAANEGPAWNSLSPSQRQALAPLERDWAGIEGARKTKWLEVAARFPAMPADERSRVQQRMAEWARLSPTERSRARMNFIDSKQLSREEKQARWEAYKSLPENERDALAARGRRAERGAAPASAAAAASAARPASAVAATSRPVAPTLVQAKPGATTVLMTKPVAPPAHQQPGQPRIASTGAVDPATLLPRTGPQAAASVPLR